MPIDWTAVTNWALGQGIRILVILVLAYILHRVSRRVIPPVVRTAITSAAEESAEEAQKRADTLSNVLVTTAQVGVLVAAGFMVLSELEIDIAPILAGVGVVGIAVGFGAQSLVRDVLAGLFILLENQYRKGDVVRIANVAGLVEEVGLRRTILRDLDGIVHFIPNGEVRVASNFTKEWSRVNLNIPVAYGEDLDRVMGVINRVGQEMAKDEYFGPLMNEPLQALRVDAFEDSGIAIKVLGSTKPIRQWEVAGEFRRRIKRVFDEEGIEIPWPHTKIFFGNAPLWPHPEPPASGASFESSKPSSEATRLPPDEEGG
jgi:small conductance mechanosensitive channel